MKYVTSILISVVLGGFIVGSIFYFDLIPNKNTVNYEKIEENNTVVSEEKRDLVEGNKEGSMLEKSWEEIKNDKKLLACYQSKKDFDQKKNSLLPKYKEILKKEAQSLNLSIEEEYIKTVYGWVEARGRDYGWFESIALRDAPNNEKDILKTKSLLEFVYCPDVSKIPITYPLTPEGCSELLLSWMMPFEYPMSSNYSLVEEYDLELVRFNQNRKNHEESVYECCYSGDKGASCTKLTSYLN